MQTARYARRAYWITGPIEVGVQYRLPHGTQAYRIDDVFLPVDDTYGYVYSTKLNGVYAGNRVVHLIRTTRQGV